MSTISQTFSAFARGLRYEDLPAAVRRRAKLLVLDAVGVAFASSRFDFAKSALAGLRELGSGESVVIGCRDRLPIRDAAMMNATLVHGLDYDDTYLPGSVHMTATIVPCALAVSAHARAGGREFIVACAAGLEAAARIGLAGKARFSKAGFQPTSVCGAMASALVAGKLLDLDEDGLTRAQGIALSTAGGSMQAAQDGTWAKRIQPGWAAAGAITAAFLSRHGFSGPEAAYEGRAGFYRIFMGALASDAEPTLAIQELGERWEFIRSSIKQYPACHQSHAFMNAAINLANVHGLRPEDVESVTTLVAEITRDLVCEPAASKARPDSSYLAQFSLPYAMAACLARRRFTLDEIEEPAYADRALQALAAKVRYEIDPNAGFPRTRTGEVIVELRDGRVLRERNEIDPDVPASESEIVDKYTANTAPVLSPAHAAQVRDRILSLDDERDVSALAELLRSPTS